MGVFSKNNQPGADVKRNSFDLSFQNNLTMSMGKLYPALCKEILPGDTVDLDMAFGLRFMPMPFPIQTKIRVDAHAFFVRSRTIYKDFQDFYGNNDTSLQMPYIAPSVIEKTFKTGSLADYLGIPTTIVGTNEINSGPLDAQFVVPSTTNLYISQTNLPYNKQTITRQSGNNSVPLYLNVAATTGSTKINRVFISNIKVSSPALNIVPGTAFRVKLDDSAVKLKDFKNEFVFYLLDSEFRSVDGFEASTLTVPNDTPGQPYIDYQYNGPNDITTKDVVWILCVPRDYVDNFSVIDASHTDNSWYVNLPNITTIAPSMTVLNVNTLINDILEANKDSYNKLRINALPFRAYEAIYNSFYRDQRNNPYIVNGRECPNQYVPNLEGGLDDTVYELRRRNWEQDFLTSALPSPQMGVAPLVGLSSTGVATYQSEDGTNYNVQMTYADDGDTIVGAKVTSDVPNDVARAIVNTASEGISINDFRAVNSLQRWLEANYRKGLKYKDQLESHFGVNPSYELLDMPEFLGGTSQFVSIDQINQTSQSTSDSPLGSYAGQASAVGSSNNTIHKYFDEPGYLMVIVSVVPVPCYSQLMPKMFLKNSLLDYYFPEFGHIGYQPIPYSEVCPLQQNYNGGDLNAVFGYQRAWYDYLASTDEVHGEFRTTLRDFVLYRLFNKVPSLNEQFLTVNDNQLNNVFSVNDTSDKILGQIHFKVHAKRPIPRFGIPRLE